VAPQLAGVPHAVGGDGWLDLVLFETAHEEAAAALAAGVDGLIVDLEQSGKHRRQEGADTEINGHQPRDLDLARELGARLRFCRVEGPGQWEASQVDEVIARGATHILLPMVRTVDEVQVLLDQVAGRVAVGILVETEEAVRQVEVLARLPLFGVFVGLNDLAIERRSKDLFTPLVDGTVERVREAFENRQLGFAGVTVLDGGAPVPARLLLAEMARLGASFAFLRRSFRRDIAGRDLAVELDRIRHSFADLRRRSPDEIAADRHELLVQLKELA
jgi:hypothetical protein